MHVSEPGAWHLPMLSVSGPGDADPRRPSLISQAYSEPPLTPSAQRARKISVFGELLKQFYFPCHSLSLNPNYDERQLVTHKNITRPLRRRGWRRNWSLRLASYILLHAPCDAHSTFLFVCLLQSMSWRFVTLHQFMSRNSLTQSYVTNSIFSLYQGGAGIWESSHLQARTSACRRIQGTR